MRKRISTKRFVNAKEIKSVMQAVKRPYVKCFGKYIPVTETEVRQLGDLIVWK